MAGSRPERLNGGCPECKSPLAITLWFYGNHGEEIHIEDHCRACGWLRSPDGEVSNIHQNKGENPNEPIQPEGHSPHHRSRQ